MKKMLIVTDLSFPTGSAMASRILSFCHIFHDLGYQVHVITGKLESKEYEVNKVIQKEFYSFEIINSNCSLRLQTYLGNENLANKVDQYLSENDIEFVFTTSLNMNFKKVFNIIKKHNKKIILEQCEWYDPSSFTFGKIDPRYINFNKNITERYLKVDGVISISRLLNDYYESKNVKTIRIPSIVDIKNKPYSLETNNKNINLVYTGNASKSKELLKPILQALSLKEEYKENFIFDIYGLNESQLFNNIQDEELFNKVKDILNIHGFVSQDKIEGILKDSDYQIFIRPNRRSSNAGFPTKLCESMSVGTPIITNDTGDIGLYLKNKENGYIVNDNLTDIFDDILKNYPNMREKARKTSEQFFDYRVYIDSVKSLIEKL